MNANRIKVEEAAYILGASPQFIRVAMQQEKLPIGIAVKTSSQWTYLISEAQLAAFTGRDIQKELANIRNKEVKECTA
ncbi:MAG: hypothetical protein IJV71_12020 [Lachnospiraceae bacterium]|nr:hypothetical protein [Lachnospiraceae bacterium]